VSNFRTHKVVSSLPVTLEPNAVYFVRAGAGFDLYCTDQTGNIAHQINGGGTITAVSQLTNDSGYITASSTAITDSDVVFNIAVFNETFILFNNGVFELLSVAAIQNLTNSNSGSITFRNNGTAIAGLSSLSISGTRSGTFTPSATQNISTGTNLDIVITGLSQSIQLAFTLRIRK
jgi:hypothetical protein